MNRTLFLFVTISFYFIHCSESHHLIHHATFNNTKKSSRQYDGVPIEAGVFVSDAIMIKAVQIPEETVTYEGSQVWRVFADGEQGEFVSFLQDTGGKYFLYFLLKL